MDDADGDIVRFVYTGGGEEAIPPDATHVSIHESVTVIPSELFHEHQSIIELICHSGVIKIEELAFYRCPSLANVIIPGVEILEEMAFCNCKELSHVRCGKLERVGPGAFFSCENIFFIDLSSVRVIQMAAFFGCSSLRLAEFGKKLETVSEGAFINCPSLERIIIPLKNDIFIHANIFQGCTRLTSVGLVEGEAIKNVTTALQLEEWRKDIRDEVDAINLILPYTNSGLFYNDEDIDLSYEGEKSQVISHWVAQVLDKVVDYKARHRQIMREAATTIMGILPNDIVMNSVLPLLDLTSHTFHGEENEVWWSGWNGEDSNSIGQSNNNVSEGLAHEEGSVASEDEGDTEEGGVKRRRLSG